MAETLAALLLAHVLADFVVQTRRIAAAKARRHPGALAAHAAAVALAAAATLGARDAAAWGVVAGLTAAHLATDLAKGAFRPGAGAFLADQAAHLAVLLAVAALWPGLWAAGLWAAIGIPGAPGPGAIAAAGASGPAAWLPGLMALTAGAVLATRAGGFAVGLLMAPWGMDLAARPDRPPGLAEGGRMIGLLERGLIFVMMLTGLSAGIGFLIAAKSVLRFGTVGDDRAMSEYVIIGTLASFGWAIAVSAGTLWLLAALPALGIPDLSP